MESLTRLVTLARLVYPLRPLCKPYEIQPAAVFCICMSFLGGGATVITDRVASESADTMRQKSRPCVSLRRQQA
jgi:hypothetical protein